MDVVPADDPLFKFSADDLSRMMPPPVDNYFEQMQAERNRELEQFVADRDEALRQQEERARLVEDRENRLAALAEGQEQRENRREVRERWTFWIAIIGAVLALIAAVTGIIAIS